MSTVISPPPPKRLGDRLLEAGLLSPHQLELALREQKRTGKMIGAVLHQLGFVSEQDIASFLAQDAQTPTVNVLKLAIEPAVTELVPYDLCKEAALLPVVNLAAGVSTAPALSLRPKDRLNLYRAAGGVTLDYSYVVSTTGKTFDFTTLWTPQ